MLLALVSCGDDGPQGARVETTADQFVARASPATVWARDRLFVYGGTDRPEYVETSPDEGGSQASPDSAVDSTAAPEEVDVPLGDAALIDPASGELEVLPPPPFEAPLQVLAPAVVVGDTVVLMGILCPAPIPDDSSGNCEPGSYAAATMSLADRTWRPLEVPAGLETVRNGHRTAVGATSDGRAVFVLGRKTTDVGGEELWSYDPETDTWAELPNPGVRIDGLCMADDTVVALTGSVSQDGEVAGEDQPAPGGAEDFQAPSLRLFNLDAADAEWTATPGAEVEPQTYVPQPLLACAGSDAVIHNGVGGELRVHSLTPGAEQEPWRLASQKPADGLYSSLLWTGSELLFLNPSDTIDEAPDLAYDVAADKWRVLEVDVNPGVTPLWTGSAVTGWPESGRPTRPYYDEIGS